MFAAHKELPGTIVDWYVQTLVKTPGSAPAANVLSKKGTPVILEILDMPGGAAAIAQKLDAARQSDPKANLFSEAMANQLGYEHLQSGDFGGAVQIMKLNAVAYPNSPNVYDSLSDAYLAAGQKDLARENAKKALEYLKWDKTVPEAQRKAIQESAETKLKQLGAGSQ